MSKIMRSMLALLLIFSFVPYFALTDDASVYAAKKKASKFITIQATEGDQAVESGPTLQLRRRDIERTRLRKNTGIVRVRVRLNGVLDPEDAVTRSYLNVQIVGVDSAGVQTPQGFKTVPVPVRRSDNGGRRKGRFPSRIDFTVPVHWDGSGDPQKQLANLYIITERGSRHMFELPELTARNSFRENIAQVSEVNLPAIDGETLTSEENRLLTLFKRRIFMDPTVLQIRVSDNPGIFRNFETSDPESFVLNVPNRDRLIKNFRRGNVEVNGGNGSPVVQSSTHAGIGSPIDRSSHDDDGEGTTWTTVVSPGGNPDDLTDTIANTALVQNSAGNALVIADGTAVDVYYSRLTDIVGVWDHVLISGPAGAAGAAGAAGPAGSAGAAGPAGPGAVGPECNDGLDNDNDGLTDFPADPGCQSQFDVTEAAACQDGQDNDGDGLVDAADPGCGNPYNANDNNEFNSIPQCSDGADNDGNGQIDFPADPGCTSAADNSENAPDCNDTVDNDGDGLVDFPNDPGCQSATQNNEAPECNDGADNDGNGLIDLADIYGCPFAFVADEDSPDCNDGVDNDGDTLRDFPADPGCSSSNDNSEANAFGLTEVIQLPANTTPVAGTLNVTFLNTVAGVQRALLTDAQTVQQSLLIIFDGTGTNVTGFQYTIFNTTTPMSPVFPATNGTAGAPNVTTMGFDFFFNGVLNLVNKNTGLGISARTVTVQLSQ